MSVRVINDANNINVFDEQLDIFVNNRNLGLCKLDKNTGNDSNSNWLSCSNADGYSMYEYLPNSNHDNQINYLFVKLSGLNSTEWDKYNVATQVTIDCAIEANYQFELGFRGTYEWQAATIATVILLDCGRLMVFAENQD